MSLGHVAWPGIIQEAAGRVADPAPLFPLYFLIPNNNRVRIYIILR